MSAPWLTNPQTSLPLHLLTLLLLTIRALAVNITMRDGANTLATCINIPPGACCVAMRGPRSQPATIVDFRSLGASDMAAVWRTPWHPNRGYQDGGCNDRVLESRPGPGRWWWHYQSTQAVQQYAGGYVHIPATGASYITMPHALPPNAATANWVSSMGLLAMVWGGGKCGGGKWVSAAEGPQRWAGSAAGSSALGGSKRALGGKVRRGIRSAETGNVWIGPPPREWYPNEIAIIGSWYIGGGEGNTMYQDAAGKIVNLTSEFRG